MGNTGFTADLFGFLAELGRHNDRAWFAAHKERYQRDVRDPMLRFIEAAAQPLRRISGAIVADPRPMGGSLFRIYRDTRFSKDKSPYKTNVGRAFPGPARVTAHPAATSTSRPARSSSVAASGIRNRSGWLPSGGWSIPTRPASMQ